MNPVFEVLLGFVLSLACLGVYLILGGCKLILEWYKKRKLMRLYRDSQEAQPLLMSKARSYTDLRNEQLLRFSRMINIYGWEELDFNNPDSWFYAVPGTISDPKYHKFREYLSKYENTLIGNFKIALHVHQEDKSGVSLITLKCGSAVHKQTYLSHNIEQFILYALPEELMELEYAYMVKNKKPSEIPNLNLLKIYESMRDDTKNAYTLF